jgi:hypothetical protein
MASRGTGVIIRSVKRRDVRGVLALGSGAAMWRMGKPVSISIPDDFSKPRKSLARNDDTGYLTARTIGEETCPGSGP